jgi:hypothetical protein
MHGSPLPIYLGCAGLIVGSLGLGAQHLLGGNSVSATNTAPEQPLFAQSVEEASLPATGWPSQSVSVAHYDPMVELLTTPARSNQTAPATAAQRENPPVVVLDPPRGSEQAQQEPRAAPREVVRDLPQQTTRQSRRAKNQRNRDDARANEDVTASTEPVETRSRSDRRRQRDPEQRAVIREEVREPEQRVVRGPEQRDGFSPFRLFGIFDR